MSWITPQEGIAPPARVFRRRTGGSVGVGGSVGGGGGVVVGGRVVVGGTPRRIVEASGRVDALIRCVPSRIGKDGKRELRDGGAYALGGSPNHELTWRMRGWRQSVGSSWVAVRSGLRFDPAVGWQ